MSQANNEEMDLDSMSMDDLDSHINQLEGKTDIVNEVETEEESVQKEQSVETSEQNDTDTSQEDEESNDKPESDSVVDEQEDIEPQYRGKTKDEILDMQRNANRKISQQNNEIYHLKKKVEELSEYSKKQSESTEELKDDLLERYNKEDIEAVNKIIENHLSRIETLKLEKDKAERESVISEHEEMWENLKVFNPVLFESIEDEAIQLMKKDLDNTFHKKGWMKTYIIQKSKEFSNSQPKERRVVRKKAVTISGNGVGSTSGKIINKSVDDMTADEYLQHMQNQGVKI